VYVELKHPIIDAVLAALIVTVALDRVTPEPLTELGATATSPLFAKKVFVSEAVNTSPVVKVFTVI
jgi:hypothetical protein